MCWLLNLQLLYFGQKGVQQIPSQEPSNHLLYKLMNLCTSFCVGVTKFPHLSFLCGN